MKRFRIDHCEWPERDLFCRAYELERRETRKRWPWGTKTWWRHISFHKSREEARAHYELIKELPEYLD